MIQVELCFILQALTSQIINFAQNPRQSQSVQDTAHNAAYKAVLMTSARFYHNFPTGKLLDDYLSYKNFFGGWGTLGSGTKIFSHFNQNR